MLEQASVRRVLHVFRASPRFALGTSLTFALGIGVAAMMFGVVDRLLIRPASHVVAPDELRRVFATLHDRNTGIFSYAIYSSLRDGTRAIDDVAAYSRSSAIIGSGVDARQADSAAVTANFFPLLGAKAVVGRLFAKQLAI